MASIAQNKIDTNKYGLEVTVNAEDFEAAVQKAYLKARKNININGFRKGSAPRKMIERMYGSEAFYEDAVNMLASTDVERALGELDLDIIETTKYEVASVSASDGVLFKIEVITAPEVELQSYKGIEAEKAVNAVTEEDIDAVIEKLREKNGRIITVEDRPAQTGDTVTIDFMGFKDGVQFDGGTEKNYSLKLGSGQFIPGFEDQITGKSAGDEFTINVTFPEGYQMEELAGAPAEFKINLHEITATELPELDDEFVKDATEFDTLDELREDYRAKLQEAAEKKAENEAHEKVFETLVGGMTAEIPEVMITKKIEELMRDFEINLSYQGLNLDSYLSVTQDSKENFKMSFREQAERQVRLRLALEKAADLEGIEITDEDAEEAIAKMSENYKIPVSRIKEIVSLKSMKADLKVEKVSEIIKNSAVIKNA